MSRKNKIIRVEKFNFLFNDYCCGEKISIVRERFNNKNRRFSTGEVSYRILNHWEKEGLLESVREKGKGWRKYSDIDLIWLHLIIELRAFGVPISVLYKIKSELNRMNKEVDQESFDLLGYYMAFYLRYETPIYFLLFSNFEADIVTGTELMHTEQLEPLDHYIKINLHEIINLIFPKNDLHVKRNPQVELNNEEFRLFLAVKDSNYKEISIKMKDGKITRIEKKKDSTEKNIYKILRDSDYSNIQVIMENGKVIHIEQTEKEKL